MKTKLPFSFKILLTGVIGIIFQYKVIIDMLDAKSFLIIYSIPGVVLYVVSYLYFKNKKGIQYDVWGAIGAILVSVFVFCFINYITKKDEINITRVRIEKIESIQRTNSSVNYIYILNEKLQRVERFNLVRDKWVTMQINDTINMYTQKGILGYEIVKEFSK